MNLKQLIKNKGYSCEFVARKLCEKKCFKYRQQVSDWCNGIRVPDLLSIYFLSEILKEPIEVVVNASLKSAGLL